jgi:hypothetical protein
MSRSCWIALVMPCFAALLLAQAAQAQARPPIEELESQIRAELESHGERVLGKEAYHWSTRLETISECRAEFTVRVVNNVGEPVTRTDRVRFSLGALEPYEIEQQNNWLVLGCAGHEKCISSVSTCTKKTREGIVVDCTSAGEKREDSFTLQLDGDEGASSRLERAFRQAAKSCHEPAAVTF